MKTANQPTTAAVAENPVTKTGRDWLFSNFLFGTEIGEGQLKETPCRTNSTNSHFLGCLSDIHPCL